MTDSVQPVRYERLGDICATTSGGTPSRSQPEYFDGSIPWVKSGDLNDGSIIGVEEKISSLGLERSSAKLMPKGTVLIAMYGATVGKLGLLEIEAATNQAVCGIHTPETLDRMYLFYLLLARRPDLIRRSMGGAQPNISQKIIRDLLVPVPPMPEQLRVVDLLSRAENIVRMRREAEQKVKEIIPALFLDMFGDPATNPKGWEVTRIEDCCTLVRGSSPRPQGDARYFGGPVPRLMIADITRDGIYVTPRIDSLTPAGAERSRPMNRGDVVMAVSGACGLPAILAVDACIHDGFVGFRALSDKVRPEYLYTFLAVMREQTQMQAVGATFQNLKTDQIREWRVPIPSTQSQDSFVDRAKNLRHLGDDMAKGLRVAELAFQSLLAGVFGEGR